MGKRKTNPQQQHENKNHQKRKQTAKWKNQWRKKKNNNNNNYPKKRRTVKYWIQDAPDLIPEEEEAILYPTTTNDSGGTNNTASFLLLNLTKVHLYDDHPAAKPKGTSKTTTTMSSSSGALSPIATSLGGAILWKNNNNNNNNSKDHDLIQSNENNHHRPKIYIQRAAAETTQDSDCNKVQSSSTTTAPYVPLPHGDCGDGIGNPDPIHIPDSCWAQRHRYFSKYDDGIRIGANESWYSVTPEIIAQHIATRMTTTTTTTTTTATTATTTTTTTPQKGMIVMDAFCGVGGNLIALAMRPEIALVIAVDTHRSKLEQAAHNCHVVYQIPTAKVLWIHGNAISILQRYQQGNKIIQKQHSQNGHHPDDHATRNTRNLQPETVTTNLPEGVHIWDENDDDDDDPLPETLDAIFLSPPWGGMDYESIGKRHYDLTQIQIHAYNNCHTTGHDDHDTPTIRNGVDLLQFAIQALPSGRLNIAYYLPRNLNGIMFSQQLAYDCDIVGCVELEQNIVNHKLKTITAYIQSRHNNKKNSPSSGSSR